MKLDRLLAMVMVLISKKRVPARTLAEMFDVSVRTVYRDVEAINQAGIPVIAYQGAGGGIGIADGFRLDKNVLTNDELAAIMVALQSLASSCQDVRTDLVLEKIKGVIPQKEAEKIRWKTEQLFVDFSSWGNDPLLQIKMNIVKEAMADTKVIRFVYCSTKCERTEREAEPYTLVLKGQKWYLYAYCRLRGEFRFFKLGRMTRIELLDMTYQRKEIELTDLPWNKQWHKPENLVELTLKFDAAIRPMAEEWFGVENVMDDTAGNGIVKVAYPEDDWIYSFILSFGSGVEVLEPEYVRKKVYVLAGNIRCLYEKNGGYLS